MWDKRIEPARISNGVLWFILGSVCFVVGVFAGLAGAGGGDSAALAFAAFFLPLSGGFFAVGFWDRLMRRVEERLMDIQQLLLPKTEAEAPADGI